ncbi:SusC/RagA family TonB-linked outer membrane protein [Dysgonomonas gadei]|uniref:TonB-dependent receptor plug domain-containing protein n=1 Tax=Dysgonomonas gadei ATCC BAA-286 TaxID=742766 RepID=F5IWJ7_9BACT|nr:TonB-dependent receptor [Dysgonomonas gadei]EGK02507.1 hypothetical protein HMPREF9455_01464 [Dysgonomonas gadei ATCC BAA-286]
MKREPIFWKILFILPLFLFSSLAVFGQTSEIKGTVTDAATGETLIGVSVSEKGTTNGTMTDLDGQYSIKVPSGATLIFTYVGYVTQERPATGGTINVALSLTQQMLDEVVVIGYGVQKKSVVTAAISSVKSSDIEKLTPSRIENVLKGQVSGVQVTQGSGQPGSGSTVRIRGIGTTGNSDPLYIVDGMAVDGGITNLNPSDIASVEILKDGASAAVYGSRAANGVVLITTKTGVAGKPKISYDMSYGFQNPWKKKAVLNSEQYMVLVNELYLNNGEALLYSSKDIADARAGLTPNTDWQEEVFNKDAPVQNHQISISGGNDKLSYYLSFGYFDQEGIIGGNYKASNYKRWSVRSNNTYEVYNAEKERSFLNKLKIGSNVTYSRGKKIGIGTNDVFGTVLGSATTLPPNLSVYLSEDDGKALLEKHPYAVKAKDGRVLTPAPAYFQEIRNPIGLMLRPDKSYDNEDKFIGTFWGELNLYKGLTFKSSYGFDLAFWGNDGYRFPYYLSDNSAASNEDPAKSEIWSSMNRGATWQIENTLNYNFKIGEDHFFTLLAGQSAREYSVRGLSGSGYEHISYDPSMMVIDATRGDATKGGRRSGGSASSTTLASYFGRLDYNFAERYMLQATVRRDGSDKFGSNNKWGTFPSFSVGWNVLNEPFMKDITPDWFHNMKLRGSWGVNGNQRIDAYAYMSLMDGGQNYYFGDNMYYGISSGRLPNPDLKWEESKQTDIGLDLGFLRNSLTLTVDYYKKRTVGMLREKPTPSYVGLRAPLANSGTMDNSGWEFDVSYRGEIQDVNFGVKANASYMKNTLVDYGNASGENSWGGVGAAGVENFIYQKNGMPSPYFYGYRTDGILQTQEEADEYNFKYGENAKPGDVRFKNLNGDDKIDDEDRDMIGKPNPDWTFGLTLNAEWKGLDFYAFFQGVTGNKIFDISKRSDIPRQNLPSWMLDRWTGPGTSNKIPRLVAGEDNRNWRASDLYIKNGAYCRLKNIQLGYTIPASITRKASIDRLRIYVAAENLLTFTKYDGFDPEIGDGDMGVDKGIYPQARTITLGASISF